MEVKGRGAQTNPHNRFLKRSLHQDEAGDGLDEPVGPAGATEYLPVQAKTIINEVTSPDVGMRWSVNPYQGCEHGCTYCYARNAHEYWGYSAGLDFERRILVKTNAAALLREALSKPSWQGEPLSIAGNTDCYQPAERKYRLTRQLLEVCLQFGQPVGLITKNAGILQDLDVLQALATEGLVHVYFSITTLHEPLRRLMEPRTATAAAKLNAIAKLTEAGVPCGIMSGPVIPGLNDHELPAIIEAAAAAGACSAGYTFVRLNGAIGPIFSAWIEQAFPDRAAKVLRQIAESHGGQLNDSQFGRRMRGAGTWADATALLHKQASARHLAGRQMPAYNMAAFRRGGQLPLF